MESNESSSFLSTVGGRKFFAFLLIVGVGVAIHFFSAKGVTSELVALLLGAGGVFSAANAAVTRSYSIDAPAPAESTAPPPPPEPNPEVTAAVESIVSAQAQIATMQAQTLESITQVQKILVGALSAPKHPPR